MAPLGKTLRHLKGCAHAALLFGCLSFLAFQQIGGGAHLILDAAFRQAGAADVRLLAAGEGQEAPHSFSSDHAAPTLEAELTDRRLRLCVSTPRRAHAPSAPISIFHNDLRPVTLRARAIFCDFSSLRHVLHPHLHFLANATAVLC